jgi:ABC-2 type transport system permease protein
MLSLFVKEIRSFLSSLIGYVVIGVFLILVGLFMWVFPGEFNILDAGFANIDTLFIMAPWVFMFLIPAITMRMFSEERRTGTIEMLLTKPLSDLQIIMAKFLAGLCLVIVALLPTLVYYFSVSALGSPTGNIDSGAAWGSYFGLLFLASSYITIGIFASSISSNQVVAFLMAVFLCFFLFIGFESIGSFNLFGTLDDVIIKLGINEHYVSMSRGLIDTRDVMYFVVLSSIFVLITRTVLQSRRW